MSLFNTQDTHATGQVPSKAIALVCFSAVLWGLFWLPVKLLEHFGVYGTYTAFFLGIAGLLMSLPFLRKSALNNLHWRHIAGAFGIGVAFTLYSIALAYTDVIRVVLLFYLAPAWSTLIECIFLGRRWSWRSLLGLFLSFAGIVVIFKGELPLDGLGALGDWLAVLAGLGWSIGAALMFSASRISAAAMSSICWFGALLVSLLCFWLIGTEQSELSVDSSSSWLKIALICILLGIAYLVPLSGITLWGATQLPPAMMSFILTIEVIVAVVSSSILLNIPYGVFEIVGTVCILAGALTEVLRSKHHVRSV